MHKLVTAIVLLLAAASSAAPSSRIEYNGKTFLIVSNEKSTWFDAASFCVIKGMNLVSFEDDEEFLFIREQLIARGLQSSYVWIGGTEIGAEDSYYWFGLYGDPPVDLFHWDASENFDATEKCMAFNKGFWQHLLCSTPAFFICESLGVEGTTTSPTLAT